MHHQRLPVAAIAATILAASASAQSAAGVASSATFITRLGVDTLAIEQFTRTPAALEGAILWRSPEFGAARYRVELAPDGAPQRASITNTTPALARRSAAVRWESVTFQFSADSVFGEIAGDTVARRTIAARTAFPSLPYSWAMRELHLARMRRDRVDSARHSVVGASGRGFFSSSPPVQLLAGDSAVLWNVLAVGPLRARVDAEGRLRSADGAATTSRYVVERSARPADIAALTAAFAVAETSGREFGSVIAGRDTARATLGHATVEISYSAPRVRGRRVFSGGVLGDTLWRTGANAATQLRIGGDVEIGGHRVPAGSYTLYTAVAPDNSRYTLVINRQVGQWGTTYDATKDLVRVPLRRGSASPAEKLRITVDPDGPAAATGVLRLAWDTTELSVPIVAR